MGEGELILFFQSVPAILTAGLVVGVVEETLFRIALQPKSGLVPTSLLFLVSRGQSGIGLLELNLLAFGMLLGLLRMRFNTSTCVLAHITYNVTIGFIEHFNPNLF